MTISLCTFWHCTVCVHHCIYLSCKSILCYLNSFDCDSHRCFTNKHFIFLQENMNGCPRQTSSGDNCNVPWSWNMLETVRGRIKHLLTLCGYVVGHHYVQKNGQAGQSYESYQLIQKLAWAGQTMLSMELVWTGQTVSKTSFSMVLMSSVQCCAHRHSSGVHLSLCRDTSCKKGENSCPTDFWLDGQIPVQAATLFFAVDERIILCLHGLFSIIYWYQCIIINLRPRVTQQQKVRLQNKNENWTVIAMQNPETWKQRYWNHQINTCCGKNRIYGWWEKINKNK